MADIKAIKQKYLDALAEVSRFAESNADECYSIHQQAERAINDEEVDTGAIESLEALANSVISGMRSLLGDIAEAKQQAEDHYQAEVEAEEAERLASEAEETGEEDTEM